MQEVMPKETTKFTFDKIFQEKIVQAMLVDRQWGAQFAEVVDVNYFDYGYLKLVSAIHLRYYAKYKEFPSVDLLIAELKNELKNEKNGILLDQVKTFLKRVKTNQDLGDLPLVKDKALDFCKKVRLQKALEYSVELIEKENYEKIVDVVREAIHAGNHHSPGLDLFEDVNARYSETYRRTIPTGIPELDQRKILNGGLGAGELGVVIAPTGCHVAGTKILMYDGSLKLVEDIVVGDKLMGPDSKPRTVLKLVRGKEQMYEIVPNKGDSFEVNENHILSLKRINDNTSFAGTIINLSVKEYLAKSKTFKRNHKLWSPKVVHFPKNETQLPIEPYVLGLMLGDGYLSKKRIELTTADQEIVDELKTFTINNNVGLSEHSKKGTKASGWYLTNNRKHNNPVAKKLASLNLVDTKSNNKFIPDVYKTSSVDDRLHLLAGLLDSDGYCNNNCFTITTKSKKLAEDIVFVGRSLGLRTNYKQKISKRYSDEYWRVYISGHTDEIPTRLTRKKVEKRNQVRNPTMTSFSVKPTDVKDFFGFTVDKDNLYVMGNFMVTHNCGKSHVLVHVGAQAILQGKNVLHYTFELNERAMGIRYDSHIMDIPSLDCYEAKDEIYEFYQENKDKLGRLRIKYYSTSTATANTLRMHIDKLASTQKFVPDMVIIDYAGIMRSSDRHDLLRMELKKVMEELRALATELDVPLWTAIQSNKEGAQAEFVDLTNMAEGYSQAHVADFVIGLMRKSAQKATGFGNIFIAKNRAGMDGVKYQIHLDTAKSKLRFLTDEEIADRASLSEESDETKSFLRRKLKDIQSKG